MRVPEPLALGNGSNATKATRVATNNRYHAPESLRYDGWARVAHLDYPWCRASATIAG